MIFFLYKAKPNPSPFDGGLYIVNLSLTNRMWQKGYIELLRLGHKSKKHIVATASPSDYSQWEKLSCSENNPETPWRGPCGQKLRPLANSHMGEPSWAQTLQPQSSLRMTGALADRLTAFPETLSQNYPAKLLLLDS